MYTRSDKRLTPIADTRFEEFDGRISPDGLWVAYVTNQSDRDEVLVRAADGSGPTFPVSNAGGDVVRWAQQGLELLYGSRLGLMSASFSSTPGQPPRIGQPTVVIAASKITDEAHDLSPAPDGKRFAVVFRKPAPSLTDIRVVLNWAQQLPRR